MLMLSDRSLAPAGRLSARRGWRVALPSAARQAAGIAALSSVLVGCAAPGEPTARHPVVPQAIKDLSARQQGNGTVLTFTLPSQSTDKKPLSDTPTVEIYRTASAPAGAPPLGKPSARPVDTIPPDLVDSYQTGTRFEFRDELDPAELVRQSGQRVTYTVRTRLSGERASGDSNPAILNLYPAPQPPTELRANLEGKSIALSWTPSPSGAPSVAPGPQAAIGYRVYRAETAAAVAAPAVDSSAAAKPAFQPIALVHASTYQDTDFVAGRTYGYVVRAVATFGGDTVESLDSNDAVVAAKDIVPPAAPENLVAVIIPATNEQAAYVELSWSISPEADFAGYAVYRSDEPDAKGERLNSALLSAPTFRDMNVTLGQRYFYRVSAVDQAGNESSLSASAEADVTGR
jgi:hypothetical protein